MGGLLIFLSVSVPFLILGNYDAGSMAVFGTALACAALGFVDDWVKITKRRSLGVSARHKLLAQAAIAIGLWYVATEVVGLEPTLQSRHPRDLLRPRDLLPAADLPGPGRGHQRREPDRRPGRAGGGLRRHRAPHLHRA